MSGSIDTTIVPGMKVSLQELRDSGTPAHLRDACAHLLIPLTQCRRQNYFLPFKCTHERHSYEICEYKEYKRHVEEQEKRLFQEKLEAYKNKK